MKWTKKIMYEECHSTPQLNHILNIVVTHQKVFRSWREHFVPYMVNSLNRLGIPSNQPENRALSISVADLILSWEQFHKNIKNATSKEVKEVPSASSTSEQPEDVTSPVKKSSKGAAEGSESWTKGKDEGSFELNQTLVRSILYADSKFNLKT